jgi:leukotriene-A4 hydrolase
MLDYWFNLRSYPLNILLVSLFTVGCAPEPLRIPIGLEADPHSYSNPDVVRVRRVELDLDVLFDRKILKGAATLSLERGSGTGPLILDTQDLKIDKAEYATTGAAFTDTKFRLGPSDPVLGAPLTIEIPVTATRVRIHYSTSPSASALQWLPPRQTAGKQFPYLYTQSEAIHARSWIPLQDTPSVRVTYSAHVRIPKSLMAVMSAGNDEARRWNSEYTFAMSQPIPSYLIALAVGDLAFQPLSGRTGLYTEPPVIERAAKEFEDTEKMLEAAETLFGPYRWGRYDILVLPPSFPYGGMENPRLTFATPTVLAGDKSLISLVAHEMAHSWSGNLVTNATWSDFWLNEGFTVYLERRIIEKVYGPERAAMEAVLGWQTLQRELARLPEKDQILHVDLRGRNPEDGFTEVPYEKGALFLRTLEERCGRERFDKFLLGYFDFFAFKSITTAQFLDYLRFSLLNDPAAPINLQIDDWVYKPGIPADAWKPSSKVFAKVEHQADGWLRGEVKASALEAAGWSTLEWLHFLNSLPADLGSEKMAALDAACQLTRSGNSEILSEWLLMAVKNNYRPAYPRLEEFLTSMGRLKYLRPLYQELAKTPEGRERALAIYRKARPTYHPIAVSAIDAVLKPTT